MLGRKCGEDEVALKLTVHLPTHQKLPAINPERNGGACKTENDAHGITSNDRTAPPRESKVFEL